MSKPTFCYTPYHPTYMEVTALRAAPQPLQDEVAYLKAERAKITKDTTDNAKERAWLFDKTRRAYRLAVTIQNKKHKR